MATEMETAPAAPSWARPTSIRLRADVLDRVRALADREGNTEAGTLRRVVALGLDVAESIDRPNGAAERGEEVPA